MDIDFLVRVSCMTYNHAPYIDDAMNGFCMQETSFPFVCMIVDDASTDGEQEVIKKYLEDHFDLQDKTIVRNEETDDYVLTFARHKTNINCYFAVFFLNYNHYGKKSKAPYIQEWNENAKYIALCEGDDFWIDPKKLQKQIEFMESNPDYVMCHTDYNLSNGGYRNHTMHYEPDDNYFLYNLEVGLHVGTLTVLYRSDASDRIPMLWEGKGWPMGDFPRWIEMSYEGKFKYLPEVTACYRILENSASHGSIEKEIKFAEAGVEVRRFYAKYYGVSLANDGYTPRSYAAMMKIAFKHNRSDLAKKYYQMAKDRKMICKKLMLFYIATRCKPLGAIIRRYYKVGSLVSLKIIKTQN